jgi:TonB family protein
MRKIFLSVLMLTLPIAGWGQSDARPEGPAAQGSPPQVPASDEAPLSKMPSVRSMRVCSDRNPEPCLTAPRAIFEPEPDYSNEARDAHYEGVCVLKLVVGTDGKTHDITVARSLQFGLDEKAVEAVTRWRFEPAMKSGEPVAVQLIVQVSFHLHAHGGATSLFNQAPTVSGIIVSPASAHVATSAQQQFTATVPNTEKAAVLWSVSGSGCISSACGTISANGLYTAPSDVPTPATLTVKATLASDSARTTSAVVTIRPSSSR